MHRRWFAQVGIFCDWCGSRLNHARPRAA
jgi:hypothetical protein